MTYTFAVGDIHGSYAQLKRMVETIQIARPDGGTVVFLGDYVDRGPQSREVIELLMAGPQKPNWKWVCLKGNHEDMMVGALRGFYEENWWLGNGGSETLWSFGHDVPESGIAWMEALPLVHSDEHRIFVHAGVDPTVPLDQQAEKDLLWLRVPLHFSGEYWGKHLVHGHTPSAANPTTIGNRTNIDSGAVFGGKLTCAVFHDGTPGAPIELIQT